PTEGAYRLPPWEVTSSSPVSFAKCRFGKTAAYHSEAITMRNCRWSSAAKSGWYDVKWSKTSVTVDEEYEITGKVHVMNAWPAAVAVPDNAFLSVGSNAGTLGPV